MTNRKKAFLVFNFLYLGLMAALILTGVVESAPLADVRGSGGTYTITLNSSNAPTSLNDTTFGDGIGTARYVVLDYEDAKLSDGAHVVIDTEGSIRNSASTKITSLESIIVYFEGDGAQAAYGIEPDSLYNATFITSGEVINMYNHESYFSITNHGSEPLIINSLMLTYSCVPYYSTIYFESNGGSTVDAITGVIGASVSEPLTPEKSGYCFDGWFADEQLTSSFTFDYMPSGDMTLYAKWELKTSAIIFIENGGSEVIDIYAPYTSEVSEPEAPTRLGYVFNGWFSNVELTTPYVFTTMPANDITLYGKFI